MCGFVRNVGMISAANCQTRYKKAAQYRERRHSQKTIAIIHNMKDKRNHIGLVVGTLQA